jgi:hypothetical protein
VKCIFCKTNEPYIVTDDNFDVGICRECVRLFAHGLCKLCFGKGALGGCQRCKREPLYDLVEREANQAANDIGKG